MSATSLTTELSISGMTCGNCARHVTEAIQSVAGVHSATVSLDSHSASVRWSAGSSRNSAAVVDAIEKEGYRAKVVDTHAHDAAQHALAGWHLNLVIAVLGTAPLMIGVWVFQQGMRPWFQWFYFVIASFVQIFAGAQFYRGAWNQLKIRSSNMDTLVALGSTTAYAFSVWALFSGFKTHLYFMEAASIITLISVGHWIESRVTVRASDALKKLLNLAPPTARRLGGSGTGVSPVSSDSHTQDARATNGVEEEIPVADLKIGDLIVLRPGDAVPTDGKVVEGASAVDEAMLTGESAPIDKAAGNDLFAGTVNLNGRLVMRVTAMGDETALAHIIASVQRAQTSRANIQRLGDRVSGVFVPIVACIALAAGLWWGLRSRIRQSRASVACEISLARAPARSNGGGVHHRGGGFDHRVSVRDGSGHAGCDHGRVECGGAARDFDSRWCCAGKGGAMITAVIFDKTGTLTDGELAMVGPWTPDGSDAAKKLAQELAGSLASPSNHPISKVLQWLTRNPMALQQWREISGSGVQAELNSEIVRLGSVSWLKTEGIVFPENEKQIEKWKQDGATIVGLAKGNSLVGAFGLRDFLKPNAAKVVWQLQQQGLKTFLLTGDNPRTASVIAKEAGIRPEWVFAEVRPEQKSEFVKKLQAQGERVAFVGDGINDAPALEPKSRPGNRGEPRE